ncbi:MAG TPA: hypothetical protein VKA06_08465 [Spirochaetia bacterium]|nr:hypothetical protein [Spirochaetia bacterium]
MALWNWLMPEIFGLTRITYWQAWGLFLLFSILFKNIDFGDNDTKSDRKRKRELRRYMSEEDEAVMQSADELGAGDASDVADTANTSDEGVE